MTKLLNFFGSSLQDLRRLPPEARRACGYELRRVQEGLAPTDWKPMPVIGGGVCEIRVHVMGEWRVIYIAKLRDSVWVLHVFGKKTRATSRRDIDLARERYRQLGGTP